MSRPIREDKPPWSAVPERVRADLDQVLGSTVVRAVRTYGGYAPSATYRLALADGRRAFFKGTYPLPEGSAVRWFLEGEERAYRRLGRYMRPWAPAYLGSVRASGWHGIAMEDVRGESVIPWTAGKARRAARSYAEFHRGTYGKRLPGWISRTQHREFSAFWSKIGRSAEQIVALAGLAGDRRREARRWIERALPSLVRSERVLARANEPFALLHFDTRSDNIQLQSDVLRIFDWPFATVGPHEFDLAAFAQSIASEGGPAPEKVVAWYAEILPIRQATFIGSVTGIAGYFADRAPRPTQVGLPRLRSVQRRQLKASLPWAARLLDLPEPDWVAAISD